MTAAGRHGPMMGPARRGDKSVCAQKISAER